MKTISWFLILSQFIFVFSQTASAEVTSPEAQLLKHVIALQGQAIDASQAQTEMKNAVASYLVTAPAAGQAERMQQALVDLKLYTPEQAQGFVRGAQDAAERVQNASSSERADQVAAEFAHLSTPTGAEFSACVTLGVVGTLSFFSGWILGLQESTIDIGVGFVAVSCVLGIASWASGC